MKTCSNRDVHTYAARGIEAKGYGNYRGEVVTGTYLYGYGYMPRKLADVLRQRVRDGHVSYVIYSYAAPVLWKDGDVWVRADRNYSPTTAKQMGGSYVLGKIVTMPGDVSATGYQRILDGLDILGYNGKLYSPHAANPAFRSAYAA